MPIWSAEIKELETLSTSVKGRFSGLGKELERLVKADDENMVLLYSRRCLEVIITDLCESELKRPRKTEPLKGIIDKLNREEKVPSNIIASMQNLNSLSTFGAHPKEFDPEQVRPVLINLTTIIKWYLKYKDTQTTYKTKPEAVKDENKIPDDPKKTIHISKKKLTIILSGLLLVCIIIIVPLFVLKNIIGDRKQSIDLSELEKSIAVLPFENMSNNDEYSYFGDAITDEIIMQLCKINEFIVRSRTSVMQYKATEKTSPVVGRELNVNYLIEGSAQRFEDQVRIRVQLIHAATDNHLWGEIYEGSWKDVLSLQSEIAKQIADELKTVLTPKEIEKIEKEPTGNLEAYDFYLKGNEEHWQYWQDNNPDHINKSIGHYLKAIELDQEYSMAYTGLGREYWMLGHYALKPSPEYWKESKRLLNKAIELDPENGWAYAELGVVQHNWDWDSSAARYSFEKALDLSPNNQNCYMHFIHLEARLGNCNEVASLIKEYSKKFSVSVHDMDNWNLLFLVCRKDIEQIKHIADQYWNYDTPILPGFYCYIAYLNNGNYTKALEIAESIIDHSEDPSIRFMIRGHINAMMENSEGAHAMLENLNKLSESRSVSNVYFANIYYALGDKERTLEYLERALQEHDWRIHAFMNDATSFNLIKAEPWLEDIIRRSWIPVSDTE
ncbi:MAG: hypothetical protein AMS27_13280 [Bacteroides sp. SM23_62_1]|nr:MAG: hypothetical protein AMS27_13280 [Bacteroides sp. SM23_62_1]